MAHCAKHVIIWMKRGKDTRPHETSGDFYKIQAPRAPILKGNTSS